MKERSSSRGTSSEVIRVLRSMRAVRRFSSQTIPEEVLQDILEVGRWTGSAKNTQPWELVVVQERAMLEKLSQLGQYAGHLAGAQLGIVLVMNGPSNALDAGRLAQNLMLAGWAHGLGSCIGSLFPEENERAAKDLLGIPPERWVRTAISFGYPADEQARFVRSTPRTGSALPSIGRKPMDEFVNWERFGQH